MQSSRTVWIVADGAGRRLYRTAVPSGTVQFFGAAAVLTALLLLCGAVHSLMLSKDNQDMAALAGRVTAMQRQVEALQTRLPELEDMLAASRGTLYQLERKSGFTFVSLAKEDAPAHTPAGATPATVGVGPGDADADGSCADAVQARAMRLNARLSVLLEYWHDAERRLANTPAVRPARTAWLSSSFGVRIDPISHVTVMHKGLDLAGPLGMLVYAPADGRVIWTGQRGGYGQVVVLDHGWGLQTHYAHLSRYLVEPGDKVRRGHPVAQIGNTGKSTGPHLHYEVRQDGYPIDPRDFILD